MSKKVASDVAECANCSATECPLLGCSRCKLVKYCNTECQRQHWKAWHKKECLTLEQRKPCNQKPCFRADDECKICMSELKDADDIGYLACCENRVHHDCALKATKYSKACPFCRTILCHVNEVQAADLDGCSTTAELFFNMKKRIADRGDSLHRCIVGQAYFDGESGVKKDYGMAFHYFKLSADQDCADAMFGVAMCYLEGKGVEANIPYAIELFKKADSKGQLDATCLLGFLYHEGLCCLERNEKTALKYYNKAAEKGHTISANQLKRLQTNLSEKKK